MQRAAMAGAARCVGRCSALHLLSRLSAPNLLPPCPPLSMGEKSPLHGSVTSSPRDRVASCIVLWCFSNRSETHFPLGWKFSSMSKPPHSPWGCVIFFIRRKDGWEQFLPTVQERLAGWCWAFRLPPTASHPGPRASGRAGAHGPWRGLEHRRRGRATTSVLSCQ